MPSTSCARSGACRSFTLPAIDIGSLWEWRKGFYLWRRTGPDPNDRLIGERTDRRLAALLGDQRSARRHIERVLATMCLLPTKSHIIRFQVDQGVAARVFLARILWLQGFPDQAMRTAESSVADARAANHAISLCYALAQAACPIALLVGDLAAAEHYVGMLLDHSTRHALVLWHALGRSHQGVLVIKRGDAVAGLRLLRAGLDELGEARFAAAARHVSDGRSLGLCRADRRRARRDRGGDRASEQTEERW